MKIPRLRWWIAALLMLSTVINYIDRQTLSVVAPLLTKELGLTPTEYSNILTAFLAAYTVMYLGSGFIVDRWGTRLALSVFVAWWSLANIAHVFARSAFSLGAFRFLLGMGEAGNFMAAIRATSEWYPPKERALVNGLVNAGAALGAIIAAPLVTWIALRFGWRETFAITGALGFVWLVAWLALYRLPDRHPYITDAERELILGPTASAPAAASGVAAEADPTLGWLDLLRMRETWGLLLSRFFSDPVWWFYLFWLPKYLVEQRGFTMVEMGMLAWMPYLAADIGAIFGGWLSGFLVARQWPVLRARAAGMLPFALIMPVSLWIAYTPSRTLCLALICLVAFAHMAWKTNLMTTTNDIYPVRVVGRISGIVAFGNGLGGTIFTYLTGPIVMQFGYEGMFVLMACMHPLAFVIYRVLVRRPVA